MTKQSVKGQLRQNLEAIKKLVIESETLLAEERPDVEKLLSTLRAQTTLQHALLNKLVGAMDPSETERNLSDTFQEAVNELLEYFNERVKLAGKVADAAALSHLRSE